MPARKSSTQIKIQNIYIFTFIIIKNLNVIAIYILNLIKLIIACKFILQMLGIFITHNDEKQN